MSKQPKKIGYENDDFCNQNKTLDNSFLAVSPAKVYLDSLSHSSHRTMYGALARIVGILRPSDEQDRKGNPVADPLSFAWHTLDRSDVAALRAVLDARYAPATANKMIAAFRGVLRQAWRLQLFDAEQMKHLSDIKSIPSNSLPAGRTIPAGEVQALFDVCAHDPRDIGIRDAAILALLIGCGLRRAEAVALNQTDYDPTNESIIIRDKRNTQRSAYPYGGGLAALNDWLSFRGVDPGPLFCRATRAGTIIPTEHNRLSEQSIYKMLQTRGTAAQIADISPHDCRRTFVSNLLVNNIDIAIVQRMAGYSNVATSIGYDRHLDEEQRRAAMTLHIPYIRRGK